MRVQRSFERICFGERSLSTLSFRFATSNFILSNPSHPRRRRRRKCVYRDAMKSWWPLVCLAIVLQYLIAPANNTDVLHGQDCLRHNDDLHNGGICTKTGGPLPEHFFQVTYTTSSGTTTVSRPNVTITFKPDSMIHVMVGYNASKDVTILLAVGNETGPALTSHLQCTNGTIDGPAVNFSVPSSQCGASCYIHFSYAKRAGYCFKIKFSVEANRDPSQRNGTTNTPEGTTITSPTTDEGTGGHHSSGITQTDNSTATPTVPTPEETLQGVWGLVGLAPLAILIFVLYRCVVWRRNQPNNADLNNQAQQPVPQAPANARKEVGTGERTEYSETSV